MSWFSPKKKIVVSSTIYSLAGDVDARTNYLKANIFANVLGSNSKTYLGENLSKSYLNGPGIKQRQFFNWAERNDYIGMPTFTIRATSSIDSAVIEGQIPIPASPPGLLNNVSNAFITKGDYIYWAEAYMYANHPTIFDSDWAAEYDKDNNEIIIQFDGLPTETFTPIGYDPEKYFVIAYFTQYLPSQVEPVITGSLVTDVLIGSLPSTAGYSLDSTTNTTTDNFSLDEVTTEDVTYSDSTPDEQTITTTTSSQDYTRQTLLYLKDEFQGGDGSSEQTSSIQYQYYQFHRRQVTVVTNVTVTTEDIGGGVTKTTTTTVETDTLTPIYDYQIDTQTTINLLTVGGKQMFLYEIGSGNVVLDDLDTEYAGSEDPEFYPFIPLRLNNVSISDEPYESNGTYDKVTAAYKKAFNRNKISSILDEIEDNPDLHEIDYAYIMFGVPINTYENSGRKYIHAFLKNLVPYQDSPPQEMHDFIADLIPYQAIVDAYQEWVVAQTDPADPLYNTVAPAYPYISEPPSSSIILNVESPELSSTYRDEIFWTSIEEEFFSGLGKPSAVIGECWVVSETPITYQVYFKGGLIQRTIPKTSVYRQLSEDSYSRITAYGLNHINYIYGNRAVATSATDGLADTDESAFIFPMHKPTLNSMSLVDATQISTENGYIVFNTYQIYKKKWYETGIFQILLIIAIIVISVYVNPTALAAGVGLLGTNAAVGAFLGLTGVTAIIAGAIVNALAAIALTQIITKVAGDVFGQKIGAIISAVAAFVLTMSFSGGFTNFNFGSVDSIMKLTNVLANAYQGWNAAEIQDINNTMGENKLAYESALEKVDGLLSGLNRTNDLSFNPISLTDVDLGNDIQAGSYLPESLDEFIQRTTMVGSDIVDITFAMITDYPELARELPRN